MKNIKQKSIKFLKNLLFAFIATAIGIFIYGRYQEPTYVDREVIVEKNVGIALEEKIEQLKQDLLDDLRLEEIRGYENRSLIIVFDPLKKDLASCRKIGGVKLHCYSTGEFNFKIATVQHYYSKFYGEKLNDKEAMLIAMDSELSRELAYEIIFNEIGGYRNWLNSGKKINAHDRITFIRSLEN